MRNTQAELERQREEEKRKMEERSDQLNASQKEALLEKFKLDQVRFVWLFCPVFGSCLDYAVQALRCGFL